MKAKKNRAVQLTLLDKGCLHNVILTFSRSAAITQMEHNKDMEKRFATDSNFRDALMQQQFRHGIDFVVGMMDRFTFGEEKMEGKALLVFPWDGKTKLKCGISPKLRRAFEAFAKELTKDEKRTRVQRLAR